jgi:hypothetical protein
VSPGRAPWPVMALVLLEMQLARLRLKWRPYAVVSTVMPAGIVLLLHLSDPTMGPARRLAVVTGGAVLAVAIAAVVMLSQAVASMKASRVLDHYRVLPVSIPTLAAALAGVYGLFGWPGAFVVLAEGRWLDHVAVAWSAAFIPVLLVGGFALGAVGILIGLAAPDESLAGLVGNLVMMAILFLGMTPVSVGRPWSLGLWLLPSTGPLLILRTLVAGRAPAPVLVAGTVTYAAVAVAASARALARPE